jgi:O-antigen/teichoic acid export membrane protein
MKISSKETLRNFVYVFLSQGISLILSLIMSFVIPKLLNIEGFGYWQYFLLLCSYVGFFHFGLIDGIYLRYGGGDFSVRNNQLLGSQLKILIFLQILIISGIVIYVFFNNIEISKKYIIISVAIYLILSNVSSFFGAIFQCFNRLKVYSFLAILDKFVFIFSLFVLLYLKSVNFKYYILIYVTSRLLGLIFYLYYGREIVFAKKINIKKAFIEFKKNISVGVLLMTSNIAGILILGFGRLIIEREWGISSFGKLSLSLSLTSFFLLFISQVSIVLFPMLLKKGKDQQNLFFIITESFLDILLNSVFLFFPLIYLIVKFWLPSYIDSLQYFVILFPLCLFEGKMQVLFSTYMKILRKEKLLLYFNLITLIVAIGLSLLGAYLKSIEFIVSSMTISVIIRSVITGIYLSRLYKIPFLKKNIINLFLAFIFCILNLTLNPIICFSIYLMIYIYYLFMMKNDLKEIVFFVKKL